jgi:transposase-like protein
MVHKDDLQPGADRCTDHIAVDKTVIRLNNEKYWLYAAVDPETNELLHTKLITTKKEVLAYSFLTELSEKHDVSDAVFLVDVSHSLQHACHRHGFDCSHEKHGNRNTVKNVFQKVKRRTICFSNCFSKAEVETDDYCRRLFSFA